MIAVFSRKQIVMKAHATAKGSDSKYMTRNKGLDTFYRDIYMRRNQKEQLDPLNSLLNQASLLCVGVGVITVKKGTNWLKENLVQSRERGINLVKVCYQSTWRMC